MPQAKVSPPFVAFEIEKMADYDDHKSGTFADAYDEEADEAGEIVNVYWTIFGCFEIGGRDAIGDYPDEEHAREIYASLQATLEMPCKHDVAKREGR